MHRLNGFEKRLVADALVAYTEKAPPEFALAYPKIMYLIAGKLELTPEVRERCRELGRRDAAKVTAIGK